RSLLVFVLVLALHSRLAALRGRGLGAFVSNGLLGFARSRLCRFLFVSHDLSLLRNELARTLGEAHLGAVLKELEADARRLAVLGVLDGKVRNVDRRLLGDDAALLRGRLALMAAHH